MSDESKTALPMADGGEERCETCRFWDARDEERDIGGDCRRMPPILPTESLLQAWKGDPDRLAPGDGVWPCTGPVDWCGEWQPKKPV